MLTDRVSNPGPLTYESGALPIALRGPALSEKANDSVLKTCEFALQDTKSNFLEFHQPGKQSGCKKSCFTLVEIKEKQGGMLMQFQTDFASSLSIATVLLIVNIR